MQDNHNALGRSSIKKKIAPIVVARYDDPTQRPAPLNLDQTNVYGDEVMDDDEPDDDYVDYQVDYAQIDNQFKQDYEKKKNEEKELFIKMKQMEENEKLQQ